MWTNIHGKLKKIVEPHPYKVNYSLNVFNVEPVSNFDEVAHHFTEVVFAHVTNVRRPQIVKEEQKQQCNEVTVRSAILQMLRIPKYANSMAGCTVKAIVQKLQSTFGTEVIHGAISDLSESGAIFETIDEYHVKSVE